MTAIDIHGSSWRRVSAASALLPQRTLGVSMLPQALDVSIGWTAIPNGCLSFQFNVENVSNKVHPLSKESTMVQGQFSIPRLFSGSVKVGC